MAEPAARSLFESASQGQHLRDLALAYLFALAVLLYAGNRLTRTIRRVALGASAVAAGDYRKRVNVRTGDELQALAELLNSLGAALTEREAAAGKQAEMLAGMAEAARVASSSLDVQECGRAIAKLVCSNFGARDATVFRRKAEDGSVKVIGRCGKRSRAAWRLVANHAAGSGEYLVMSERDTFQGRSGQTQEAFLVGIPLTCGAVSLGAIVARFENGVSRNDLKSGTLMAEVLTAFGVHGAEAINNAEVHAQTQKTSEALKDSVEKLTSVAMVTDAISPSLDLDETLAALADTTVTVLDVDQCGIALPDRDGCLRTRACSGPSAGLMTNTRARPEHWETGEPFTQKRSVICADLLRSRHELSRELAGRSGMRAMLGTPLLVDGRAIGVITVATTEGRKFTAREVELLESIASHAAVIVRNASLYARESSIAEALQNALVSEAPEECLGLRFASRYMPVLEGARVGGDFFVVTPLPNGTVGVVMADVSGKGLSAAMHLATCKYMMKSLMHAYPDDPAKVLGRLNEAVNYYYDVSFFTTIFYGVIDPKSGHLTYASAGHLPALLITREGRMHTSLAGTGIPVGSGHECRYEMKRLDVSPSDRLLLYTDGVTDTVKDKGFLEIEGLQSLVFDAGYCSAAELVEHICMHLISDSGSVQRDDIALLAVSFDCVPEAQSGASRGTSGKQRILPA
jgi:GAF domain-containing protein